MPGPEPSLLDRLPGVRDVLNAHAAVLLVFRGRDLAVDVESAACVSQAQGDLAMLGIGMARPQVRRAVVALVGVGWLQEDGEVWVDGTHRATAYRISADGRKQAQVRASLMERLTDAEQHLGDIDVELELLDLEAWAAP